jgi:rsbT co-antagonist protein RsbR
VRDFLSVRTADPNLARIGRLSAIILLSMTIMTGAVALFNLSEWVAGGRSSALGQALGLIGSGLLLAGLYMLNRRGHVNLVGIVLPPLVILAMLVVPDPQYTLRGPSALAFAVPVVLASVVAVPWSSFVAAALCVLGMAGLAFVTSADYPRIEVMATLFAVALIAWLAAEGLEKALGETQRRAHEAEEKSEELRVVSEKLRQTVDQQAVLLKTVQELEVPVIPLLPGLLTLPLVGHVDSDRAQQITETLLQSVHLHRAHTVIIDVTGLSLMDSAVAQALTKAAQGVRLLGAQVVFSGISAEMAQTLVSQGIRLPGQATHDMQAALQLVQREQGR